MNVKYSRSFQKSVNKLSGKMLTSVMNTIIEVKNARKIGDITDCIKITGYDNVYRIRIGIYRAFFTLHIYVEGDFVFFEYLTPRGQAYDKNIQSRLKKKQ